MKTTGLVFLLIGTLVHGYHHHHHHEPHIGYFWEDYTDSSLAHAVKGGTDSHDKITYIGQVKHVVDRKDVLSPGIIYPDEKLMVYELDKNPEKIHEHFKILCTNYPDHMKWLPTDTEEIKNLVHEKELIEGGVDAHNNKIYIGRVQTNSGLLVGKVLLITTDGNAGFHTTVHSGYIHKTSFEVLAHVMPH